VKFLHIGEAPVEKRNCALGVNV